MSFGIAFPYSANSTCINSFEKTLAYLYERELKYLDHVEK